MNRRRFLSAAACGAFLPTWLQAKDAPLDTAFVNASIWTGDPLAGHISALGIRSNRIAALGEQAVQAASGRTTQRVDLDGAFVVPGFIDSHTHFLRASQRLSQVDLLQVTTPRELVRVIAEAAGKAPEGSWLQGGNWDEQRWGGELPTRYWIDGVTPHTPVAVSRTDLHMTLVNSLALRLAGIDRDTPDPPGGIIVRDAAGEPTGIIKDAAKEFVERVIPKPTAEEIDRAMRAGIDYALARGVTQVHVKAVDWATHYSLRRLRSQGETGIRFYSYVPLPDWQVLAALVEEEGRGDEWVRWGGLKGFVDGSLGSRTALFHEPYADAPDDHGIKVVDLDDLRQWIGAADSRGLQVAVHAIGDRANDLLLDMFADVIRANGERDRRFLVEHAQHIRPKSIARFRQLGVIPCMQPYHAIDDGRWAIKRIGPERLKGTYAFRSLLDQGALLSFGLDWPVAPLNPLTGIEAAVLRRTTDGANPDGWLPEQKLSVEESLTAYTAANAHAGFQEHELGRLRPGMLADFTVLSDDLRRIDPSRIARTEVLRTVLGGQVRYDSLN